ncbi:hypothetical protein [Streptomyces wuyuanensis]|uniref:hypothetical protein n=1 Tax=Streptomyces wuyuanensis TaxID=1196353 RepID=UPI003434AE98
MATTWPKALNTTAGPLGDGATSNLSTTREPQFVVHGTRLYYPAVTTTALASFPTGSVGAGCLDLLTQTNCSYVPLQGLTDTPGALNVNGLGGFVRSGNNAYGVSTAGQVLCFRLTSRKACPNQPFTTGVPANPVAAEAGRGPSDYFGALNVIDKNRVFIAATNPTSLSCVDTKHHRPCQGWETAKRVGTTRSLLADAVYPAYTTKGQVEGICVTTATDDPTDNTTTDCFRPDGRPLHPTVGSIFPTTGTIAVIMNPTTLTHDGNPRSYFPYSTSDQTYTGHTLCHDWATRTRCTGFPPAAGHPTVNAGRTYDYNYTPNRGCLLGLGDSGWLFSINPTTGTTPC